jgi:hypothetical protein
MSKKMIIAVILAILVVVPALVYATTSSGKVVYEEPPRSSDVPSHAKWDAEQGCYVNTWVSEMEEEAKSQPTPIDIGNPTADEQSKWIKDNKNTNDIVDKAIVEWYNHWIENPAGESYFDINKNDSFKYLTALPVSEIPNIIKKIENKNPWRHVLMFTAMEITKTQMVAPVDTSTEGTKKWLEEFKQKVK